MMRRILENSVDINLDKLDNNFLLDVDENLSKLQNSGVHRWSKYNRPPITTNNALAEYENGMYQVSLYIYVELLVSGTVMSSHHRDLIDSLLDKHLSFDNVYKCLSIVLRNIDKCCRDSYYNKGVYLMGISYSLNNILTSEFNPKDVDRYPEYIRMSKLIIRYFKQSVSTLMGCNLELEFDVVNTLNFNLAKVEINYGIILTSPYITSLPECKNEYMLVGEKALKIGISRLNLLFQKDIDKKYLILASRVLERLGENQKSKEILSKTMHLDETSTDLHNLSIIAEKNRNRSHKHKVEIY